MAGEIQGINQQAPQRPVYVDQAANLAKGAGLTNSATQAAKEIAALLGGKGVSISAFNTVRTGSAGETTGATGIPQLDNPADEKALQANLEKLIAYLQLDNEERQAEMAKERIEVQKQTLSNEHSERLNKINESLEKMDEAAKARTASRIFGWLGAIVAVIAAVVTTVVTGGAAAGFAIAGAALAVAALVSSETGLTDKIIEGLAKELEKAGLSKQAAQIVAALAFNIAIIAASAGLSVGGLVAGAANAAKAAAAAGQTISATVKAVQSAVTVASTAIGLGGLGSTIGSTVTNYKSQMSNAEVTELEKIMQELQRRLEESEEELKAILEAIQNSTGQIVKLLASETDTQSEIASKIGQMA